MSEVIPATSIVIEARTDPDCGCNRLYLMFRDAEGDIFAGASLSPQDMRGLAENMGSMADIVEARTLRQARRLA